MEWILLGETWIKICANCSTFCIVVSGSIFIWYVFYQVMVHTYKYAVEYDRWTGVPCVPLRSWTILNFWNGIGIYVIWWILMIKLDLAGNLPSREKLIFANCTEFGWTWAYYRPRLQGFSKIRIIMSVYVQILCFSWKLLIVALIYRTKYSCIPYAISFQKMYSPTFTTYF